MLSFFELEILASGDDVPDLFDLIHRPAWMAEAACRGVGAATFFPERGQSVIEAKAICARCPVRKPCLEYAFETTSTGIWAGTSERGRAKAMRSALSYEAEAAGI